MSTQPNKTIAANTSAAAKTTLRTKISVGSRNGNKAQLLVLITENGKTRSETRHVRLVKGNTFRDADRRMYDLGGATPMFVGRDHSRRN
jgi:hypothetical protein